MTLEEVQDLKKEGKSDEEIIEILRGRGLADNEIADELSHSQIKTAIEEPQIPSPSQQFPQYQSQYSSEPSQQEYQENIPSFQPPADSQYPQYEDQSQQDQAQTQEYSQQSPLPQEQYGNYQPYQPTGLTAETITEIAEQVVAEKASILRSDIEKMKDLQASSDSQLESIDERLKRLERIIDKLQLSILQKVGDYVTNVEDIKKEVIETQKSFKALVPALKAKHHKHHP